MSELREIERFAVKEADGRTWRFALLQRYVVSRSNPGRPLAAGTEYRSLDDADWYYINENGIGRFKLVDFRSDGPDIEVERV